jgi:hypothetical protein
MTPTIETFNITAQKIKVGSKVPVLKQTLNKKMCVGSGGIVPSILNLGTRWRSAVSFMLQLLCLKQKNLWYPLDRRWGGPQSQCEHDGKEKILALSRN